MGKPHVSIVIVNYNGSKHLDGCLNAILKQSKISFELIVVDNGSTDGSAEYLTENFPTLNLVQSEVNLGYSRAINLGVQYAKGTYIMVLNMDIVVERDWLSPLVNYLESHPEVGIVAPCILLLETRNDEAAFSLFFPNLSRLIAYSARCFN